jgi:hypothetical protein
MGEARRRKLLGIYPDGSQPKPPEPVTPSRPIRIEERVCQHCRKSGGTLKRDANGLFSHIPDCDYAAACRARQEHRRKERIEKLRSGLRKARRLLRGERERDVTDSEIEAEMDARPDPKNGEST